MTTRRGSGPHPAPGVPLRSLLWLLVLLCPTGCVLLPVGLRVEPETQREGVELRAGASVLEGLLAEEICQISADASPPPAVPITSDLIRTMVARLKPAVVNLTVESATPLRVNVLGVAVPGIPAVRIPGESLGSGFFCSSRGIVLTNAHVVKRATRLSARTADGKLHELDLVAVDREADLALLRANQGSNFPATTLGAAGRLAEGDWVIAIGNPLGLNHTVSHGIVSQRSRSLGAKAEEDAQPDPPTFLQSDTPINPGSSGGPLLDLTGRVVGINTAIARGAQGISFTTPTERIVRFLEEVSGAVAASVPAR